MSVKARRWSIPLIVPRMTFGPPLSAPHKFCRSHANKHLLALHIANRLMLQWDDEGGEFLDRRLHRGGAIVIYDRPRRNRRDSGTGCRNSFHAYLRVGRK